MKNIYLIRHCSADGQHKDSPLTSHGIRQAKQLADFLAEKRIEADKIVSSPYLRAIESIRPYAEKNKLNITVDDRLKERILSEDPIDDWLEVLEQSFNDLDFRLPGGESGNDAVKRAEMVIENVLADSNVSNVVFVSHGNIIALLLSRYQPGFGFEGWKTLRNPDVYLINADRQKNSIECLWQT
ncbi:histidine phosphatase family protein [Virgibacillus kekensis]|uniref:Histidine phosphatase family protein n=1 Tax=Virgibacillus kekensis TaxID=202261 RepID=A0ABV9DH57_9BACI